MSASLSGEARCSQHSSARFASTIVGRGRLTPPQRCGRRDQAIPPYSRLPRYGFGFAWLVTLLFTGFFTVGLHATERIPSAPARYFNDYAGITSTATTGELNARLEQYERESSNQLLVVIYPRMESDSSVEDYTVRVAQAWGVGQKGRSNGAVLFAFMQEHKLYIQVGYGLEGALPDAIAKRIIERDIVPRFRQRDFDGGMRAAVNAMIAATKGEYTGTGRTAADGRRQGLPVGILVAFVIVVFILAQAARAFRGPQVFVNPRRRSGWWIGGPGNFGGGGGGWSSGGGGWSSGGGGGGFSGGGGSFGGGGAGGSW